ncbi:organic cation transporter protein-like [Babylonia areolata]|uniref:organic cation transporter protein-like n=1 Tax=Babylonia areolata TaxID=304850 RepID=UPI003FD2214A
MDVDKAGDRSEMTSPTEVTFDDALKNLGAFGRYQMRVLILMSLLAATAGVQAIFTVFTVATPNFRCAIPGLANDSYSWTGPEHDELLNVSVPWEKGDDDKLERSKCKVYQFRNESAPPSELLPNRSTESCHRWVYDHSVFTSTFTEDENLVCDKKEYHANADMIYMVGLLVGSLLVGLISDRYGRKVALMLSITLHVGCSVGTAFAQSFAAFATLRFFLGLANMGAFMSAYVIGLEMVGDSVRTMAGSVMQMFWPIGLFVLDGVAYGVRDWRHLQLIMSCPTALFLLYFFAVTESPRWLASKGRYDEANAILKRAAEVNGVPPPPRVGDVTITVPASGEDGNEVTKGVKVNDNVKDAEGVKGTESGQSQSPLRMFTNRVTLIRTLIIFVNWVMITMIYYGLSLNVGSIGGDIHLNFFLSALAELLGYVVALVGLDRAGRKAMHCGSMILAGLACLCTMIPVLCDASSKDVIVLVLSNVGKLGASAAFCIIYQFSAELFPTVIRNSMMGASSMMARLGGIVSPYIAQLNVIVGGKLGVALPLVVFGGCGLLAGLLALQLPETLKRPLPATIEDAINIGKKTTKTSTSKEGVVNRGFDQI